MLRWIILIILILLFDLYAFQAVRTLTKSLWVYIAYWVITILVVANFAYYYFNFVRGESFTHGHGYAVAFLLTLFLPKVILIIFMFGEDLVRGFSFVFQKLTN